MEENWSWGLKGVPDTKTDWQSVVIQLDLSWLRRLRVAVVRSEKLVSEPFGGGTFAVISHNQATASED
jgi:hypothetical protein